MKYSLTIQAGAGFVSVDTLIVESKSAEKVEQDLIPILKYCGYSQAEAENIKADKLYYLVNCDDIMWSETDTLVDKDGDIVDWETYKEKL